MNTRKSILHVTAIFFLLAAGPLAISYAQQIAPENLSAFRYRYIGPVGNRVTSVAGVPGQASAELEETAAKTVQARNRRRESMGQGLVRCDGC